MSDLSRHARADLNALTEAYVGFDKLVSSLMARNPGWSRERAKKVAAAVGRRKYGAGKFQAAAAAGRKLGEASNSVEHMLVSGDSTEEDLMEYEERLHPRGRGGKWVKKLASELRHGERFRLGEKTYTFRALHKSGDIHAYEHTITQGAASKRLARLDRVSHVEVFTPEGKASPRGGLHGHKAGDRVTHPELGGGKVVAVGPDPYTRDLRMHVKYDAGGERSYRWNATRDVAEMKKLRKGKAFPKDAKVDVKPMGGKASPAAGSSGDKRFYKSLPADHPLNKLEAKKAESAARFYKSLPADHPLNKLEARKKELEPRPESAHFAAKRAHQREEEFGARKGIPKGKASPVAGKPVLVGHDPRMKALLREQDGIDEKIRAAVAYATAKGAKLPGHDPEVKRLQARKAALPDEIRALDSRIRAEHAAKVGKASPAAGETGVPPLNPETAKTKKVKEWEVKGGYFPSKYTLHEVRQDGQLVGHLRKEQTREGYSPSNKPYNTHSRARQTWHFIPHKEGQDEQSLQYGGEQINIGGGSLSVKDAVKAAAEHQAKLAAAEDAGRKAALEGKPLPPYRQGPWQQAFRRGHKSVKG